ncbi:MAG: sugar transferase [Pseudomonadota bacterium]
MKHESVIEARIAGTPIDFLEDFDDDNLVIHPLKRAFDLVVAIPALIFLSPLLFAIAIGVRLSSAGPSIFFQERCGLGGRMFQCLKFRTMVVDAKERLEQILMDDPDLAEEWKANQKLRKDPRITPFGLFLRKTSLDELPQLVNIIRGDMSIIGPRPIVASERSRYGEDMVSYNRVRPGVTGLWQISGRNDTTYEERVALDVEYVEAWSLKRDLEIFFKSIPAILFSRGAY